jgi:hypothetical protein
MAGGMMRRRWFLPWLAVWLVCFGLIAGCGGGSHHHKAPPKTSSAAPTVLTSGQQSAGGSAHPPGWGLPPKGTKVFPKALPPRAVPTAEMYDAICTAVSACQSIIPRGAHYLAGYTSGFWPSYFSLARLFWHPYVVSIAISASRHAQCLDIEPGDATPPQAAGWYFAVKSDPGMRGSLVDGKPCEYSSFWEYVNQVLPDLRAHGIPASALWKWDANYTFRLHLDEGFDCTQWTDRSGGVNRDESTCTLAFFGYHPKPPPPPPPHYPYPVNLMTSTENVVLKSWYDHKCHLHSRAAVCVGDSKHAKVFSDNIWKAKQHDRKPWGFRNRGIRFHVLTLIEY